MPLIRSSSLVVSPSAVAATMNCATSLWSSPIRKSWRRRAGGREGAGGGGARNEHASAQGASKRGLVSGAGEANVAAKSDFATLLHPRRHLPATTHAAAAPALHAHANAVLVVPSAAASMRKRAAGREQMGLFPSGLLAARRVRGRCHLLASLPLSTSPPWRDRRRSPPGRRRPPARPRAAPRRRLGPPPPPPWCSCP